MVFPATVTTIQDAAFNRIATTSRDDSLGKIYSRMTMMMGMTPTEGRIQAHGPGSVR